MPDIEVEIEKLVYGGAGLARLDGATALIPRTLPGEKLTAEVVRRRGKIVDARAVSWQLESPDRQAADCAVFGECGGCQYQHIPYSRQLDFKESILRETLARIGKIEWSGAVKRIAAEPWGYRNRTQLHIAKQGPQAEIGFLAAGSHRLVSAAQCPINSPKLNQAHEALTAMAAERRFPSFLKQVELFTNGQEIQLNVIDSGKPLAKNFFEWAASRIDGLLPGAHIDYPSGGDVFRVGSRSFFQVNRFLIEELTQAAIGEPSDGSAGSAVDLYCGVGLLTLPLARRFDQVIGVDSSGAAMRSLQFNAERAGVAVRAMHVNVDRFLADFEGTVDFVVADPPRAGLGEVVTAELLRIRPGEIALVSCDPSTLARDLRKLVGGGYEIASVVLLDLFPQTFHLETVVRLRRS